MQAILLLRAGSEALHLVMGGVAVFCLYYAATLCDDNLVRYLLFTALKFGGLATVIVYFKGKYLDG